MAKKSICLNIKVKVQVTRSLDLVSVKKVVVLVKLSFDS